MGNHLMFLFDLFHLLSSRPAHVVTDGKNWFLFMTEWYSIVHIQHWATVGLQLWVSKAECILILLFHNHCIIFPVDNCKPTLPHSVYTPFLLYNFIFWGKPRWLPYVSCCKQCFSNIGLRISLGLVFLFSSDKYPEVELPVHMVVLFFFNFFIFQLQLAYSIIIVSGG